ncbi:MAG TPA: hypothetical protein VI056_01195 [Candidatus Limnocylindria bacterium]
MTRTSLAWALLAAQAVLMVAFVGFSEHARPAIERSGLLGDLSVAVVILAFPAVGVLIVMRRQGHPVGWLFCFANVGWSVVNAAGAYARDAVVAHPGTLGVADVAVWLYGWPGRLSVAPIALLLLVFPDGSFLSGRWRAVGRAVLAIAALGSFGAAFAPGPMDETIGFAVDNPFAIHGALGEGISVVAAFSLVLSFILVVAGAFALLQRYGEAPEIQRLQIKWFVYAAAVVATMLTALFAAASYFGSVVVLPAWASAVPVIALNSAILLPLAAALAILRHRLYDIDVLINRTLVYGATTATLVATYALGVLAAHALLRPFTQGNELAVAASTLAVAALIQPVRRRIQSAVDRRFYRSRYDAARTVDTFALRLRDEVDLDALRAQLIVVARDTMQPAHASVWLRERPR